MMASVMIPGSVLTVPQYVLFASMGWDGIGIASDHSNPVRRRRDEYFSDGAVYAQYSV